MDRKITAVDFDRTLAITEYPEIISPIDSVIEYVKERQKQGRIIILWTCRHDKELEEPIEHKSKALNLIMSMKMYLNLLESTVIAEKYFVMK